MAVMEPKGPAQEYRYKAIVKTPKGNKSAWIEAPNEAIARQRLRGQGVVLLLKKKGKGRKLSGGMSYGKRQIFLSRLAAMLGSGIGASEALNLMKVTFKGVVSDTSSALLDRLEVNSSLPEAMRYLGPKIMPRTTVAMIEAGSHAGDSSVALRDAMEFERTMHIVKKESGKGIWQAIFSFIIALIFILGTVFGFLPYMMESQLMQMMDDKSMMEATETFSYAVGYVMGGVFLIFVALALLGTIGRKIMPERVDRIILKIPYYSDLVLARTNFIAFYGLSLMVKTGVSMEASFRLLSETTPPGALKNDFVKAERAVKRGQPWANEIRTLEATDRAALGAAQDRKQIANAMSNISTQYRDIYGERMAAFVPVIQGISAVCLLLSGLIMFGLTILPMMQMVNTLL